MQIKCPILQCGYENPPEAVRCLSCGANLKTYGRLLLMPDYWFNQGLTLAQNGYFQQAEQFLQATLLFRSWDVEAMLLLAQVQALQGIDEAAAATFERASEKGTNDPHLKNLMTTLQESIVTAQARASPPIKEVPSTEQSTKPSLKSTRARQKKKKKKRKRR